MAKKNIDKSFQVEGTNEKALFTLKVHRGDGMALLAMNWKKGKPSKNFVGFGIEFKEPGSKIFNYVENRLNFPDENGEVSYERTSSMLAPIQKFRWVHFPKNAELDGQFEYKVTPVFMNDNEDLIYGEPQSAKLALMRETYPGQINIAFTRGYIASQAFANLYASKGPLTTIIPDDSHKGPTFVPSHPKSKEALEWMGFEARSALFELLDQAYKDKSAKVYVVAFDLSQKEFIDKLVKLGKRLNIIIDDSKDHKDAETGESQAERKLVRSAGRGNVLRQHCGVLQHNKMIIVEGKNIKKAVGGSTNFSWRGFYVQSNNAFIVSGAKAIKPFLDAFNNYWEKGSGKTKFGKTLSAEWHDLQLSGIDAKITFSPHSEDNLRLQEIADDIDNAKSSVLFSLAFLSQTPGAVTEAVTRAVNNENIFAYGISDKRTKIEVSLPDGNTKPVYFSNLSKDAPEPFKSEPWGEKGTKMHHKFVVLDFDKPTARVYLGSYNFSNSADAKNGENLILVRDRRIVTSYMIEAIRLFDHYHFRVVQNTSKTKKKKLVLKKPPVGTQKAWWEEDYTDPIKIKDRKIFS